MLISSQSLFAEYLFLKDGRILKGQITDQNNGVYRIKEKDKPIKIYKRHQVLRVLYSNKPLKKMVIRLNSGEEKTAYKVGETLNYIILRSRLYSAVEIKVAKKNILFTTETNPSGLIAISSLKGIYLSWKPPYNPVIRYNVYLKAQGDLSYRKAGSTTNNTFKILHLKKGVQYSVYIKAVDRFDDESLESNIVSFYITKTPPTPQRLRRQIIHDIKDKKKIALKLAWSVNRKRKTEVNKYYIYRKAPAGYTKIGETGNNSYIVKNLSSEKTDRFILRSVNDKGNLSFKSRSVHTREFKFSMETDLSVLVPAGDFYSIFVAGPGINLSFNMENLFIRNFILGINIGYWYMLSNKESINNSHIIPLALRFGYRINLPKKFFITPAISGGVVCMILSYKNLTENLGAWALRPLVTVSFGSGYKINNLLSYKLSIDYGFIIDGTVLKHFLNIHTGVLFSF